LNNISHEDLVKLKVNIKLVPYSGIVRDVNTKLLYRVSIRGPVTKPASPSTGADYSLSSNTLRS